MQIKGASFFASLLTVVLFTGLVHHLVNVHHYQAIILPLILISASAMPMHVQLIGY
jgi:general stress protein CsbA